MLEKEIRKDRWLWILRTVVNTYFKKKDEHRVTYKSSGKSTQVDYVMCRGT